MPVEELRNWSAFIWKNGLVIRTFLRKESACARRQKSIATIRVQQLKPFARLSGGCFLARKYLLDLRKPRPVGGGKNSFA